MVVRMYSASAHSSSGGIVAQAGVVIVGGTRGIGRELARAYAERGDDVVITGRDADTARQVAGEVGGTSRGLALDLARPREIATVLEDVGPVRHLVLAAIDRDANTARDYDIERALGLVTLKLVGYTEVIHTLHGRMTPDASILLFGGLAKDRPYPGSTTVSTVNGGVTGMVHALAVELAPIRINAIHPGIVGDSPMWRGNEQMIDNVTKRTPIGRPVTMAEIVGACEFLLQNGGVNGVNLAVDGGWMLL
jgi:NAD(P)-dependent dehydrogenase (short-subunit alcohol dehydrogenase family)